ncbi:MAG: DUF2169 domain-containing protein [Myxococcales bacterium]|nr:DUF2169 domain-containing protein [Myxococcales bacterium]
MELAFAEGGRVGGAEVATARPEEVAVQVLPEADEAARVAAYHFVVKRSYRFDDAGALRPAPARPLCLADAVVEGDDGSGPPLAVSELVPPRPRCDVVVIGHCHPPGGEAVECVAAVQLGAVEHRVRVVGDRTAWLPAGARRARFSSPRPFSAMPLDWRRAWGGRDRFALGWQVLDANPVGCGYWCDDRPPGAPAAWFARPRPGVVLPPPGAGVDRYGPLPNLLPESGWPGPDDVLRPVLDDTAPAPAGFGWRGRGWAGAGPNRAPAGLQVPHPGGGAALVLVNLRAGVPRLTLRLPHDFPRVYWNAGSGRVPVLVALDAITVEPDAGRLDLVWRGTLPMPAERRPATVMPRLVEVDGALRRWQVPIEAPVAPDAFDGGMA